MMKRIQAFFAAITVSMLTISCGSMMQPRQLSPAEIQMQQQMMQALQQGMAGNNLYGHAPNPIVEKKVEPAITEAEMAEKINLVPAIENGVNFIKRKDGFEFNGMRHIDPEGSISAYSCNPTTGDTTYFASTSSNTITIKWFRATVQMTPITIAKAQRKNDSWDISTVTGKNIRGKSITTFSKGVLIGRDATGFLYIPGEELMPITCPEGFQIAEFQNGDISETGYILIERVETPESDQIGSLISKTKNLGAAFGINKKEDYCLFNYRTQKQIPINVSVEGKNVAVYSGFKKSHKGGLINEYSKVDFFESLYDKKTGLPNSSHYYWRISWFNSSSGPLLIVSESGSPQVTVHNILTDKKVTMFERMLGINWVKANKRADGKIQVKAKLGFSTETIEDTEAFLNEKTVL